MTLDTCRGTGVVVAACRLTIGIILRADVVWESLRVLGGVGSKAVGADAAIREAFRVTGIVIGGG